MAAATMSASAAASTAAPETAAPAAADQVKAPVPALTWAPCPASWGSTALAEADPSLGITYDCTTAAVPLDYDKPDGTKISVAMRRVPAKQQHNKIGTLFLNPGGPGGSGVSFMDSAWALFSPWVRDKFDIVGFDPRGIARSTPLVCFDSQEELRETMGAADPLFPATEEQFQISAKANTGFVQACDRNAGPIIDHMSTANVARDMDLLRQAVGDDKLTYNGISYGTQLGQTYAAMYPDRVRAIVLDAVVDPEKWSAPSQTQGAFLKLESDVGTYDTYREFLRLCEEAGVEGCALNALGKPGDVVDKLAQALKKDPVRIDIEGTVVEINYQTLVGLLTQNMYGPVTWKELSSLLAGLAVVSGAVQPAPGAPPVALSASQRSALGAALSGVPMQQTSEGLVGVVCVDSEHPQSHRANWNAGLWASKTRSGYFGQMRAWHTDPCAGWPGKDTDRFTGPYDVKTSNPVLVVGVLVDPATPHAGAVAARENLSNSRLLTYAGWGHPAIGQNVCTDNAISNYLLSGALPKDGAVCRPTGSPFDTPSTLAGMGNVGEATKTARVKAYESLARIDQGATQ